MNRRGFFGSLAAITAGTGVWLKPRPLFADHVRRTFRRLNRNANEHTERRTAAEMSYRMLEDPAAFHRQAEHVRLAMIHALRTHGAPINVWRVGQMDGVSEKPVNAYTGEKQPWRDVHYFRVRTRVSVEKPPFQLPADEAFKKEPL